MTLLRLSGSALAALSLAAASAAEPETPPAAMPPPPDIMRNKPPISELLLKEKREGAYFTGLPLVGVTPESGVIYGGTNQWYDNGPKDSPFFADAPYRKKINAQIDLGTKGRQEYILEYDQPYIADTPWRVRRVRRVSRVRVRGLLRRRGRHAGAAQVSGHTGGDVHADQRLFRCIRREPGRSELVPVQLLRSTTGPLRPPCGARLSWRALASAGGLPDLPRGRAELHRSDCRGGINQETKLREDSRSGKVEGFDDGWLNLLRVGLTYDSRDYEPDPTAGILAQALLEGTMRWLGAGSNLGHVTVGLQGYQRLFPECTRLVLAGNLVYSGHFGDTPFFALPSLAVPEHDRKEGLGGWRTLRGYYGNRFVGDLAMQGSLELRWSLFDVTVLNQHLKPMLVPFMDLGRVFDKVDRFSLNIGRSPAVRVAWNLATVVSFEYGMGSEGGLFYMELGHQF